MAGESLDEWYPAALRRYDLVRSGLGKGHLKETAFELHQATESLYHCVLLTVTYTPRVHNLGLPGTQAERVDRRLVNVWPSDNPKQRAMFEKLKEAYVKARYSKHYRITAEELAWIAEQVEEPGRIVHAICAERIAELRAKAAPEPA
ncbi:HEPN domain-containing protein [Novosphingobium sp. SL115]|uniref:HEPN domain-containing protein n=1 Tax=Novosphingobium sp. SL115 TaxID=2995150 RepID=UPI002DD44E59|nr:HEPN domain-containing protein [Novosphingobium sp. SL115]